MRTRAKLGIIMPLLTLLALAGCATPRENPAEVFDGTSVTKLTKESKGVETLQKEGGKSKTDKSYLLISLVDQKMAYIDDGIVKFIFDVSTGKKGHETPEGKFLVGISVEDKVSTKYPEPNGGAPMPYAINVSDIGIDGKAIWTPIWIHAGDLPGEPASHGCIRLKKVNAVEAFNTVPKGARIEIFKEPLVDRLWPNL